MTATVIGLLLYFVGSTLLLIQRSHDMNLSGWWSIAAFIPLVGLFWLFNGGTPGVNRWGAPPPPNTRRVEAHRLDLSRAGHPRHLRRGGPAGRTRQYTLRAKAAASH